MGAVEWTYSTSRASQYTLRIGPNKKPLLVSQGGAQGSPGIGELARRLVGSSGSWERFQLRLHYFLQSPHHGEVWVDVAFFLAIENLLTIHVHFEPAIGTRGERDSYITSKGTEELVRHPRGGRVMFSSYTVHDIYKHFPLRSHRYPPSYELSSILSVNVALSLRIFYAF